MFKNESQRGYSHFVDNVEEAIKHLTRIWVDAADYQDSITTNVQVFFNTSHSPPQLCVRACACARVRF
jgi:hypothetical protein